MADMRLVVTGAGGRMGRMLIRAVHETAGATLSAALERPGSPLLGTDAGLLAGVGTLGIPVTDAALEACVATDGILDFTTPAATVDYAGLAAQARIAHVIGTTGLGPDDLARIAAASWHAPIVRSGNMSLGVNLLAGLVERVAHALGDDVDIGFATLRGGSVVGDHTVIFAAAGERLELTHRAEDRSIFARGAVRAALWAFGRKPGLYGMKDVLGLGTA